MKCKAMMPAGAGRAGMHTIGARPGADSLRVRTVAGGSLLAALQASAGDSSIAAIPANPLRTIFVAFILAQCGLGAILFARSSSSLYVKALVATLTKHLRG
jgi:hypothetical protein